MQFWSSDLGALVLVREVLKISPNAGTEIYLGTKTPKGAVMEQDFWQSGIEHILNLETRFGRVGLVFDVRNAEAQSFCEGVASGKAFQSYAPKDSRRAEKKPRFTSFPTEILHHMAEMGWGDSVEFRRILRKYVRRAKQHHVDTLFFLESIFAEEKTRKIVQHIAGSQVKCVFVTDIFSSSLESTGKEKGELLLYAENPSKWLQKRTEKILHRKIGAGAWK